MNALLENPTFQIGHLPEKLRTISASELASGWNDHWAGDPLTEHIEEYSATFVRDGMPDEKALLFVRIVCAWGGLRGNNFQLFRDCVVASEQRGRSLGSILRTAKSLSEQKRFEEAIKLFDGLKGVGISFRSKVLRFLCPDYSAVLDSIIRDRLGYKNTPKSYATFVSDCISIRDRLGAINYPHPLGRPWRTTDVEMGIFLRVK